MSGTFYKQCGSRLTDHVVMAKDALNVQPWRQEAGQGTGWSRGGFLALPRIPSGVFAAAVRSARLEPTDGVPAERH